MRKLNIFLFPVNLSTISFGMGCAWGSPVLVKLRNATETVLPEPLTEEEGSWIVSIGSLTGFLGLYRDLHWDTFVHPQSLRGGLLASN